MVKKAILKGSIFIIVIVIVISILNPIFSIKIVHRGKLIQGLYEHTGNAYDVVLLGSSHMNSSINPNILWNEYGITSYNYGTGGQPIDVTYYLLKEVLKNHDKPIVVVDLYYLGLKDEFGKEEYIRYVIDNMKFSPNKVSAIVNCTPRSQWMYYLFPIMKYHRRWKELKEEDFNYDSSRYYYTKGFGAGRNVFGKESLSDILTTKKAELPPKAEKYLYKFINHSKKEGFQLIFTIAPHDYTSTAAMDNWHKEPARMFNKVAEIAIENGIPFVNFNSMFKELGFDFKCDMYNEGHMNIWGSNKVTSYFGKYLKGNYELADHRNDEKYGQWAADYAFFSQEEEAASLKTEENAGK